MVVDAVLRVPRPGHPVKPGGVGLVVAEQQLRRGAVGAGPDVQRERPEERVLGAHGLPVRLQHRGRRAVPRPGVAVPELRQHVQGVGVRPGVGHADRHEQVERRGLGVVDVDHPVAVAVEHPGVQQLELRVEPPAAGVLLDQPLVGERGARVVVAPPVPGVAGHRVEEPPVLLGVLAVVALVAGQAEDALLEDRVAAVPQGEPDAQPLLDVAEARQPVLAPPVGAGAGVVVRQVGPGLAVGAVVLPHRAPLPFREVGPPQVPVARAAQAQLQPAELRGARPLRALGHPVIVAPRQADKVFPAPVGAP